MPNSEIMAKRRDQVPLFALLVAHARWSCVWAWLEHVAHPHPKIQIGFEQLLEHVNVAAIFSEIDLAVPISPAEIETLLQRWFNQKPDQGLSLPAGASKRG